MHELSNNMEKTVAFILAWRKSLVVVAEVR
jgi:hypothetical protein